MEDVIFKMDLTNNEKTKKGQETFYYKTLEFVLPQIKKIITLATGITMKKNIKVQGTKN